MRTKNTYELPIEVEDIQEFRLKSPAHVGNMKNAVDFLLPEGKKVYAAQKGKVIGIKDDSKIGGDDKKYWNDGNYIIIEHSNREYSLYEHLNYKGVKVKVGNQVKKGQVIGVSGNTGYTKGPHLHFQISRVTGPNPERDFETLEIVWRNKDLQKKLGKLRPMDDKNKKLEKLVLGVGIFFILSGLLSLKVSITGFVISTQEIFINPFSSILFLLGILGIGIYLKNRK